MASGDVTLVQSVFTLTFFQAEPGLPFIVAQEVRLEAQVDVDDGRLSVANTETGLESTSAPD